MAKRVIIVDANHLMYTYANSGHRLTKTVMVDGKPELIDTTVQNGVIKAIHRWSNCGSNPTAICFDSPVPARKGYFAKNFDMGVDGDSAYKGKRNYMPSELLKAIEMTKDILVSSGVSCYKGNNYEADDLVFACIQKAKKDYPGMPIDVITNDADLLPLVDEQVSVFLRSKKMTWAEHPDLEKAHYVQVTPKNFQEVVEGLSAYKKFYIPYNTLLFHKLVRGDSSDNITGVKRMFPPKKYNELINCMVRDGIDFSSIFRYGECPQRIIYTKTGETVLPEEMGRFPREDLAVTYDDSKELVKMLDVLSWYLDDEVLLHIKKMYRGMNLNQAYLGLGTISRKPAVIGTPISSFNELELQKRVDPLGIKLRLNIY